MTPTNDGMTDEELDQVAAELWKRMEPFAKAELERLFTNYMSTRTLLEPELVKKLFEQMQKDIAKFVMDEMHRIRTEELKRQREAMRQREVYERWRK